MLLLIPLPFLAIGCICFIICAAVPLVRRYALSTSLWAAAFGTILTAALIGLFLIFAGASFVKDNIHFTGTAAIYNGLSRAGFTLFIVALLLVIALTTSVTLLHGAIVRRLTFPLFRIYVAGVSFGVGALTSFPLAFWLAAGIHFGVPATLSFVLLFLVSFSGLLSYFCFQHAADFRGVRPDRLNPITPEEYAST